MHPLLLIPCSIYSSPSRTLSNDNDATTTTTTTILTIPRSDLDSSTCTDSTSRNNYENYSPTNSTTNSSYHHHHHHPTNDTIVLLQLPPNWTVMDLLSSSKQEDNNNTTNNNHTYFIGNRSLNGHQQHKTNDASVSLVVENKNCSFDVYRVETSNALVMIKPPPPPPPISSSLSSSLLSVTNNDNDNTNNDTNPLKRCKLDNATSNNMTTNTNSNRNNNNTILLTRLVKHGGSGASFLELRPKQIHPYQDLQALLPVWDPYTISYPIIGKTITELAMTLHVSTYQIQLALFEIQAYPIQSGPHQQDDIQYVVLADEVRYTMNNLIISTLAEEGYDYAAAANYNDDDNNDEDNNDDYFETNTNRRTMKINLNIFTQQVFSRTSDEEKFGTDHDVNSVIRFCTKQLTTDPTSSDINIQFSVPKIAMCVARRILLQTHSNTVEHEKFLHQWQSDVPGVGSKYQVSTTMLRGLAIRVESKTPKDPAWYWKYLPKESIGQPPNKTTTNDHTDGNTKEDMIGHCMEILFHEKTTWLLEELHPYFERCIDINDSVAVSNILLRYTKVITKESNGVTIKYYQKK